MKKIILSSIVLVVMSVQSLSANTMTQNDIKFAIDKLIKQKVDKVDYEVTKTQVYKNEKSIKKLDEKILEIDGKVEHYILPSLISTSKVDSVVEVDGTVFGCRALNLRKDPSTNNRPRGWLARGDHVKIIDGNNNGWFNVVTAKGAGWVSGRYIKTK